MISTLPSSSTHEYQYQNTHDPFEEFLSQFLFDTHSSLATPTPAPTYASTPTPASTTFPASLPHGPPPTCRWISRHTPPHICGAPLPLDPKRARAHFRMAHDVRGNDKVTVCCYWYGCHAVPMQRGSVIRHVLTVHLRLLQWRCETCGRVFSRMGTGHECGGGVGA